MSAAATMEEAVQQRQEEREAQAKEVEGEPVVLTQHEHITCAHG